MERSSIEVRAHQGPRGDLHGEGECLQRVEELQDTVASCSDAFLDGEKVALQIVKITKITEIHGRQSEEEGMRRRRSGGGSGGRKGKRESLTDRERTV